MSFTGFEFRGKHSYNDFGLTIESRKIGNPSKIKRMERVPFSNEIYDFSNVYGGQEYEEREIEYTINLFNKNSKALDNEFFISETEVLNWLMGSNRKEILKDDLVPGYYFLAEVISGIDTDFLFRFGKLTVTFTAYPFKISELKEGHDLWDPFNFLLDYAQTTEFTVNGTKEVTLYNPGASVIQPKIIASNAMTITKGNTTFNVPSGESKSHDFILHQGENKITIKGNGTIEFLFHKELI